MAGKAGAALVEGEQQFPVKVAALCQSGIHGGACMALGADKTVPSCHFWVLGVNIHMLKIQNRQKLNNRETTSYMTNAKVTDAAYNITADVFAYLLHITAQFNLPPNFLKGLTK